MPSLIGSDASRREYCAPACLSPLAIDAVFPAIDRRNVSLRACASQIYTPQWPRIANRCDVSDYVSIQGIRPPVSMPQYGALAALGRQGLPGILIAISPLLQLQVKRKRGKKRYK